jgi:hypothetical protein
LKSLPVRMCKKHCARSKLKEANADVAEQRAA